MMQEYDPLGISSYMRSRLRELLGNEILGQVEPLDVPRFALSDPFVEESSLMDPLVVASSGPFYINPDVEWAFPGTEAIMPLKGPAQIGTEKARGHRPIPGVGTEILETTNTRPARSPRRLFRVDVTENDEFYFLRADLAGMTKENVKIAVDEAQNLISFNVEPPKDDFFGLYKSPLESQHSIKEEPTEEPKKEPVESTEPGKEPTESESKQSEDKQDVSKQSVESIVHKKEICHLIERSTMPMSRTLKMPKAVEMHSVEAEMREGLLVVKFSKRAPEVEEHRKHSIEIK